MVREESYRDDEIVKGRSDPSVLLGIDKLLGEIKLIRDSIGVLSSRLEEEPESGIELKSTMTEFREQLSGLDKVVKSAVFLIRGDIVGSKTDVSTIQQSILLTQSELEKIAAKLPEFGDRLKPLLQDVGLIGERLNVINKTFCDELTSLKNNCNMLSIKDKVNEDNNISRTEQLVVTLRSAQNDLSRLIERVACDIRDILNSIKNIKIPGSVNVGNFPAEYPNTVSDNLLCQLKDMLLSVESQVGGVKEILGALKGLCVKVDNWPKEMLSIPDWGSKITDNLSKLINKDIKPEYPTDYPDHETLKALKELSVVVNNIVNEVSCVNKSLLELNMGVCDGDGHNQCDILSLPSLPEGSSVIGRVVNHNNSTSSVEEGFELLRPNTTYVTPSLSVLGAKTKTVLAKCESEFPLKINIETSIDGGVTWGRLKEIICATNTIEVNTVLDVVPVLRCSFCTSSLLEERPKKVKIMILAQA